MSYVRRQRLSWARIKLSCFLSFYFTGELIRPYIINPFYITFFMLYVQFFLAFFYLVFSNSFFEYEYFKVFFLKEFIVYFSMYFMFSFYSRTLIIILPKFFFVNTFFKYFFMSCYSSSKNKKIFVKSSINITFWKALIGNDPWALLTIRKALKKVVFILRNNFFIALCILQ